MAIDDQMLRRYHPWGLPLESGFPYKSTPRTDEPTYVTGAYLLDSESAVGQGAVDARVHTASGDLLIALLSAENPRVELERPVRLEMGKEFCFHVMPHGGDCDAEADTDADADDGADAYADADDDADPEPDPDRVIVMFEGFFVTPRPVDMKLEKDDDAEEEEETGSDHDECGEEETGSDHDECEEEKEETSSDHDECEEEEEEEKDEEPRRKLRSNDDEYEEKEEPRRKLGSNDDEYEEKEERDTDSEVDRDVASASSACGNAKELRQVVAITMAFLGILLSVSMLAFLGLIM